MSWADWDSKHPDVKRRAKNNFLGFKRREGMPEEHASAEFDRIHAAGTGDNYMKSSRLGARFTANRMERQGHLQHFENAYNHASFEVRKMEFAKLMKGSTETLDALVLPTTNNINPLDLLLASTLSEFTSVIKGTAGKHWKWHGNKGSIAANVFGGAYKATHNDSVSRFTKTYPEGEAGANLATVHAQQLHTHLTANGFKPTGSEHENLPWRNSATTKYQHPDGTQVESVTNQAKDGSTQNAHGFSVYHADAPNSPDAPPPAKSPATAPIAAQGVNHPSDHMAVANTILQQYGGNKFRAMTGAHSFTASKEKGGALTMKLPHTNGATKGVKYVKTVHDPATDTYDVHMLGRTGDVKHSVSGIYADQLQSHFKHHTGLDTHL